MPLMLRMPLLVLGLAGALCAQAEVYRCMAADGSLTFSQTPCAVNATVSRSTPSTGAEAADCALAAHFALSAAKAMRADKSSSALFDEYGGFDAMSKSAANIVNYVYRFSHSEEISAERISALAEKQCRARAFGDFRCDALPAAYVEANALCREEDADTEGETAAIPATPPPPDIDATAEPQFARTGSDTGPDAGTACRALLQSRIDAINAAMRNGYDSAQGERYRAELRGVRNRMNEC